MSYQVADPAKLEEDTPTPQHYILLMNPPPILYLYTIAIQTDFKWDYLPSPFQN